MILVTTTHNSKTYSACETLKRYGFVFDPREKSWSKKFENEEEFLAWESGVFRSVTFVGRRKARLNEDTHFEIITLKN